MRIRVDKNIKSYCRFFQSSQLAVFLLSLLRMDEPDIVYCEVKNVQPAPPPLPKRSENIPASFTKVNWPRINYPPRSITTFTNSCKKCCQKSTSKTNVFLRAAVVSFFILSLVFMTLYFKFVFKRDQRDCLNVNSNISRDNTEKRRKPCILQNCSTVNNPKGGNNKGKSMSTMKQSLWRLGTISGDILKGRFSNWIKVKLYSNPIQKHSPQVTTFTSQTISGEYKLKDKRQVYKSV